MQIPKRAARYIVLAVAAAGVVWFLRGGGQSNDALHGVTPTTIRLGNTVAYSGDFSFYGDIGRAMEAYFKKVNAEGGINGRTIDFRSVDDGFAPPRTLEAVRKLVEQDDVLAIVAPVGTPPNAAIQPYLNEHRVPQLFVVAGDERWADPAHFPWTVPGYPAYSIEGGFLGAYARDHATDAKMAVLYENDDYGRAFVEGLHRLLGNKAKKLIVAEQSYEYGDASVQSQVVNLKNSGANVLFNFSTPRFAFQIMKKMHEMNWKPMHLLDSGSSSTEYVMGLLGKAAAGTITFRMGKDLTDPRWEKDPGMLNYQKFCDTYFPDGANNDVAALGYNMAQMVEATLRQAGNDLTRSNVLKQATSMQRVKLDLLLPDILLSMDPKTYYGTSRGQLVQWDGSRWLPITDVVDTFVAASAEAEAP